MARMCPRGEGAVEEVGEGVGEGGREVGGAGAGAGVGEGGKKRGREATPAERMDRSRATTLVVGGAGIAFCLAYFRAHGADLNHNVVNFMLLSVGMLLHPSPVSYAKAISASLRGTGGIVLQYPFYGGIMALLRDGGLGHLIAEPFVALASAETLPFCAYLASVATKLFIPSGGGEWAVEGPIMIQAAKALGASVGKTTMGIAYGNMVGNMFQPFWAIPLLAILGLEARAIMGYCLIIFALALPVLGAALLL
jgi:short-chain fatty acids transporter